MESLAFTRTFLDRLPGDPIVDNRPRQVHGAAWSAVAPTAVAAPTLLAASPELAALLGLDPTDPDFAQVFGGNALLPGMAPYSACYGGHQFGHWAGQLGDGRAITLGEAVARDGSRQELQLKGAGRTPYSRTADGRAVLRSSLREFVCSEAMFHLGVPTTRALSLVGTGERVLRDMFYDGHATWEPGAVVCRVAPSFLRFGSYELPASRGDAGLLEALLRYTFTHLYPELGPYSPAAVPALFAEVAERTMRLVTEWERVGFVHGVMNTDNLSMLGLTIDYGPYGWLEPYDPDWTPNTTDAEGRRYRFGNQARVALWNLARLAESWVPLVGDTAPFEATLQAQLEALPERRLVMHRAKLGLDDARPEDSALIAELFALLQAEEVDYTLFFRGLARIPTAPAPTEAQDAERLAPILPAWYAPPSARHEERTAAWLRRYAARVAHTPAEARRAAMNAVNPLYVPRNYLAQTCIDAATAGDVAPLRAWLDVLRHPYSERPEHAQYAEKRPEWARNKPGCSTLSCSS